MSGTIHCIPGLGADEKIFSKLQVTGHQLVHLALPSPGKGERIWHYAERLSQQIMEPDPVILGMSFGGMLAIEIASFVPVKRLILISTVKSREELPAWMKRAGKFNLHRIFPARSYWFTEWFDNAQLGVVTEEEKELARDYRRNADRPFIDWAIHEVVSWQNKDIPAGVLHIHGSRDRVFPIRRISGAEVIEGGTHMMIYNRAPELAALIEKELEG